MNAVTQSLKILRATNEQLQPAFRAARVRSKTALLDFLATANPKHAYIYNKAKEYIRNPSQAKYVLLSLENKSKLVKLLSKQLPKKYPYRTRSAGTNGAWVNISDAAERKAYIANYDYSKTVIQDIQKLEFPFDLVLKATIADRQVVSPVIRIKNAEQWAIIESDPTSFFGNMYKIDEVSKITADITPIMAPQSAYTISLGTAITPEQLNKMRMHLPHVKPNQNCLATIMAALGRTNGPNPDKEYVSFAEVEELSRQRNANWRIELYTELGAILGLPWATAGRGKAMRIPLTVSNSHCRLITAGKPTAVAYHDYHDLEDGINHPSVVSIKQGCGVEAFTAISEDGLTLHKVFRPPAPHDQDPYYYSCTNQVSYYYKKFVRDFNLRAPSAAIAPTIRAAELFITRAKLAPVTGQCTEVDHNSSYPAFETNPYYIGFPSDRLYQSQTTDVFNPEIAPYVAFVAATTTDPIVHRYFGRRDLYLFTAPYYRFLVDAGADVQPKWCILTRTFTNIAYQSWLADNVDIDTRKSFSRLFIGMLIAGGLHEQSTRPMTFAGEEHEVNQMIHEAQISGLDYHLDDGRLVVNIPTSSANQLTHIHSYILGYSAISMHRKWLELEHAGHRVIAYNVDALVIEGAHVFQQSTAIGGFKSAPLGDKIKFWQRQHITSIECSSITVPQPPPEICLPAGIAPKPTFFAGPAGIGKTHPWLKCRILPPTKELRDDLIAKGCPSVTVQKEFRPDLDDDKWAAFVAGAQPSFYPFALVDECTMLSKRDLARIFFRANAVGCLLFFAGDFVQIQHIEDPADATWYTDHGITIVDIKRTPTRICRQDYEFGSYLDQLRGQSVIEQRLELTTRLPKAELPRAPTTEIFITGSHARALAINAAVYEQPSEFIIVRKITNRKRKGKVTTRVDPKRYLLPRAEIADQIWWSRDSINAIAPAGKKYVPAFAVTPDSIQGKTIADQIIVDLAHLPRAGCIYTAVTRAISINQLFIY